MRNIQAYTLEFYNLMSGKKVDKIEEIPSECLEMLSYMRYEHILYPIVGKYIQQGKSCRQASMRFGITTHKIRQIGRELGIYALRPTDKKRQE